MKDIVLCPIPLNELAQKFEQIVTDSIKAYFLTVENDKPLSKGEYGTRREVANELRISLPTLNELSKDGTLTSYHIGGRVLYKWTEVYNAVSQISTTKYKRKAFLSSIHETASTSNPKTSNSNSKVN